jgi:hypothetical protein
MFHEVKILDPNGNFKKTLSGKELSKQYWNELYDEENGNRVAIGKGKRFRKKIAKRMSIYQGHIFQWS